MIRLQVQVVESYAALSQQAAGVVADLVRRKPAAVLGLPTGSTPEGLYALLPACGVSFAQVKTFNLDEYVGLPPEHPQSYHAWMERHLFSRVDLRPEHIHLPDGMAPDPVAECRRYEACIAVAGGLDLVLLGLGPNGHIGFNEPGTPWDAPTRPVDLAPATRRANARFFGTQAAVPQRALTMGIGTILSARRILLLAAGARKAAVVQRLLSETPSPALPASALFSHPDATLLLDRAAAGGPAF